jgi:hypothetical protein
MNKHKALLTDMKEILETVPNVSRVSIQGHEPLLAEDAYASIYLVPGADVFTPRTNGTGLHSYDNSFFIRCIINDNLMEDTLRWTDTRDQVIQAVLKDSEIWTNLVDRDVSSIVYDDLNNFPFVTFEIIFEFKIREDC